MRRKRRKIALNKNVPLKERCVEFPCQGGCLLHPHNRDAFHTELGYLHGTSEAQQFPKENEVYAHLQSAILLADPPPLAPHLPCAWGLPGTLRTGPNIDRIMGLRPTNPFGLLGSDPKPVATGSQPI